VLAQQAGGSFAQRQRLYYGSSLHDLAAADVNGDGAADLIVGDDDQIVLYRPGAGSRCARSRRS
jgi:hypothetical protein